MISFKFHIQKSLIVFKARLGNWIFVILKEHSLILIRSSLISKVSINIHEYGYKIICISNHQIKLLCPGIKLVASLVF